MRTKMRQSCKTEFALLKEKVQALENQQITKNSSEIETLYKKIRDQEFLVEQLKLKINVLIREIKDIKDGNIEQDEDSLQSRSERTDTVDHKNESAGQQADRGNGNGMTPQFVKKSPKTIHCQYCQRKFRVLSGLLKHLQQVHQKSYSSRRF